MLFLSLTLVATTVCCSKEIKIFLSYRHSLIVHSSMVDNNATDTTEDGQRKQVHSENRIRSPSLMGSDKDQGEVDTGNSLKGVSQKRKRGRSATKHKKATKKIIQKQSLKE